MIDRTGKSYLLNRLIGQQHGFNGNNIFSFLLCSDPSEGLTYPNPYCVGIVGGTVKACTKGIWLWGAPIRIGDTTYVFMDSEGLGSIEQEQTCM
jgi:hypothetical protein